MENKEIEKSLYYEKTSAWKGKSDEIQQYAEGYKTFLESKTERECVDSAVALAVQNGFTDIEENIKHEKKVGVGDKLYYNYKNKCVVLFNIGIAPLTEGLNITAAHIDSPRLDLKQVPVYEDSSIAFFKTHYYGGIKKYQWTTIPLALHGVIYTTDGEKLQVKIGEDESDPVFYISDLLAHLASDQMAKKGSAIITGEQLNIIIGSIPSELEDISKRVKFNVLSILMEKFNINENSFLSAEIEVVPAGKPRDVGFDRSILAAYGHDDRVCAYPAITSLIDAGIVSRTSVAVLCDKEEIGSVGSTGLESQFFENIIAELVNLSYENYTDLLLRRVLANSRVLSMDVTSAYDPNFSEAFEKMNSAVVGYGSAISKFTGSRGKSGSSDANSEYLFYLKKLFDDKGIVFQTAEIGKVDQGGGGTVAYILAAYGADTVDFGVPVLSMHAPMELISKADLYSCYEASKVFYQDN